MTTKIAEYIKPGRVLPVRKRRISHPEANEQAKVVAWAHRAYRQHPELYPHLRRLHCSLNGVKLSKTQAGIAKGQGMLRGVPDLFLPVPRCGLHGLYIEMKYGDNRPTPDQKLFLKESNELGYATAVCYSAGEAILAIRDYYGVSDA